MSAGRSINTFSQEWCTPAKYVEAVRNFFGGTIDLDPCSNSQSIVHATVEYRLPDTDGLRASWDYHKIYVNPPYGIDKVRGTSIKNWLAKCCLAHEEHASEVLALVPVATNTGHWKQSVFGKATAICFLYDTRLRFLIDGSMDNKGAPMACCMIYWGGDFNRFSDCFLEYGAVVDIRSLHQQRIGVDRLYIGDLFSSEPERMAVAG